MLTYIVSDLHIGSRYFLYNRFNRFLDRIPDNSTLILNGDVIDNPLKVLPDEHQNVIQRLTDESSRLSITWIYGNHDHGYVLPECGAIRFVMSYQFSESGIAIHGHYFDDVMPVHSWFLRAFRRFYLLRLKWGATSMHVAEYAKRWTILYTHLRRKVMINAVRYCRENNYRTVICGHVHFPEDSIFEGIRYINTGAWTEAPTNCVVATDETIKLITNPDL